MLALMESNRCYAGSTVLVVSYFFPPAGTTGVIRIAKFAKYLPSFSWYPVILASNDPGVWLERSLLAELPSSVMIRRSGGARLRSSPRGEYEAVAPARLKVAQDAKRLLREIACLPDPCVFWVASAVRTGLALCHEYSVQAIFASGGPWTNLLVATLLSRLARIPAVVDFRDVWAPGPPMGMRSRWRGMWDRRMEAWVVKRASCVVNGTGTRGMREYFLQNYHQLHEDRVFDIPSGFDPEDFGSKDVVPDPKAAFRIVYTGQIGGFRSPRFFLQALAQLLSTLAPDAAIRAEFWGDCSTDYFGKTVEDYVSDLDLQSIVSVHPTIDYKSAATIQVSADLLLVLKGHGEALEGGAMASKLLSYVGTGKPVLALAPMESEIAEFVLRTGCGVVVPAEDVAQIARSIVDIMKTGGAGIVRNEPEIQMYSRLQQAKHLAKVLDEATQRSSRERGGRA